MKHFLLKNKKPHSYFEGYYVRFHHDQWSYAFILAVSKHPADRHAFLQIFDGKHHQNTYIRYDVNSFYDDGKTIHLGPNRLSAQKLLIDTDDLKLKATFEDIITPDKSAMGFFRFLPLECFQEVLMLDGKLQGELTLKQNSYTFTATCYLEKTYGKQFPKRWFWIQANHFDGPISLSTGGGDMPLPASNRHKFGFYIFLRVGDKIHRFGTFNRAKIKIENIPPYELIVSKGPYRIKMNLKPGKTTLLKGPHKGGKMTLDVAESLEAVIRLRLYRHQDLLLDVTSRNTAMEWMYA